MHTVDCMVCLKSTLALIDLCAQLLILVAVPASFQAICTKQSGIGHIVIQSAHTWQQQLHEGS